MKITLKDGTLIERLFSNHAAAGYVATNIEIGPDDIKAMREMAERDPANFRATMFQLEHRFPERRAPRDPLLKMRFNAELPLAKSGPYTSLYDPKLAERITADGATTLKIMLSSAYGNIGNPDEPRLVDYLNVDPEPPADDVSDPCPDCGAELKGAPGGGVKCPKCPYWFCY